MKFFNIKAIAIKNFHQLRRDPRMLALSVIAPVIVTALFGFAFGGDLTHLRVLVINDDKNFDDIFADKICNKMADDPKIKFNTSTSDPDKARESVDNNYTQAAIIFSKTFTEDLLLGRGSEIELYVSYSNPNIANYIISTFQNNSNEVMTNYFGELQVTTTIVPVHQGPPAPLPAFINISLCKLDLGWSELNHKFSKDLYEILDEDETIDLEEVSSIKKSEDLVQNGKARALIIFSEDFTYDILIKKEINIEVKLDGAEPQASMAIVSLLSSSLADLFEDKFDKTIFNIEEYYYNNPDGNDEAVDSITYFTPAIIGFIVFFFAFLLTMLSFLRERKQGTMERILTSPTKRSEIILGYILSYSVLALIQATVVIIVTIFIFKAQIQFSWTVLLQTYLVVYILLLAALGLGIFLSTLAKSEFQIIQFIPLVILPFMLLSGVWAPVESLPEWLRPASSFVLLTYANNALRNILIRGQTIFDVLFEVVILTIFAILMIILGIISLNKKLK
ncbi:MAG: ABC transporter permease [Promethearchaeota archaeon]